MQHLNEVYASDWMKIVRVGYFEALDECCSISHLNWTYDSFVRFPKKHGFHIDGKHILHESGKLSSCAKLERPALLQAWLFFRLIYCVVRNDERPFLDHERLVSEGQLDTTHLPSALNEWDSHMRELYQADQRAAIMRLLEANQILELAKQVVLANLAEGSPSIPGTQPGTSENIRRNGNRTQAVELADKRNLCIMVLGETLSAVLTRLIRTCNVKLPGWELDDGGGWGPPAYVSKRMLSKKWCPRSQATIKGQLGRNATLLYVTLLAHDENLHNRHSQFSHSFEKSCTPSRCVFIEAEHDLLEKDLRQGPRYNPSHSPTCRKADEDCIMVGPDEEEVLEALEEDDDSRKGTFPLMKVCRNEVTQKLEVKVEPWRRGTPFATISHVWSQGLGNRSERKIRMCQLHAIQDLVSKVFGKEGPHLFWLDTFAIPQRRGDNSRHTKLKRKAIGLIHHIFNNAEHCIIIDRYLMTEGRTFDSCRIIGAELLASGWMMRLWTLQEAFVSDQLHIALCDHNDHLTGPPSLDNLWAVTEGQKALVDSMTGMMKRKVDQSLMRVNPIESMTERSTSERALLIASAWRAVRYRTTRNPGEETLALSSLLDIPISQDHDSDMLSSTQNEDRERLMERFWSAIAKDPVLGKAIPPGIIFLPGKRLSCAGFRWAPATWMSGEVEAYPFPLDNPKYPTQLTSQGLLVHYPGFLLHPTKDKLGDIISTNKRNAFEFCVGRGLDEWYKVVAARKRGQYGDVSSTSLDNGNHDQQQIALDLKRSLDSNLPLRIGIILSRPRPVEVQGEIGLLVEICGEKSYPFEKDHPVRQGSPLYCRIIRRVEVTRLSMGAVEDSLRQVGDRQAPGYDPILSRYEKFMREEVAGVHLDDTQSWCVDGFPSTASRPPPLSRRQTEAPRPLQDPGVLNRLRRAWTGGFRLESADQ